MGCEVVNRGTLSDLETYVSRWTTPDSHGIVDIRPGGVGRPPTTEE
jgi:hypothetical protein